MYRVHNLLHSQSSPIMSLPFHTNPLLAWSLFKYYHTNFLFRGDFGTWQHYVFSCLFNLLENTSKGALESSFPIAYSEWKTKKGEPLARHRGLIRRPFPAHHSTQWMIGLLPRLLNLQRLVPCATTACLHPSKRSGRRHLRVLRISWISSVSHRTATTHYTCWATCNIHMRSCFAWNSVPNFSEDWNQKQKGGCQKTRAIILTNIHRASFKRKISIHDMSEMSKFVSAEKEIRATDQAPPTFSWSISSWMTSVSKIPKAS